MKLSISTWSYHRALEAKALRFDEVIKRIKDLGADGIELITDHLDSSDIDTQGLKVSALSIGNNYDEPEVIKQWIEKAPSFKTNILRIFAGWPPEGKKNELWPVMIETIKGCIPAAEKNNIILAVEPHDEGGFVSSSEEALRLIAEVNSPYLRLNLDTGNYLDKDIYLAIEKTLFLAAHIHYKIHDHEPVLDYPRISGIIKNSGYQGFISLEYEGEADELENVPKYFRMLKESS